MWEKTRGVFEVEWTAIGFCKAEISEPHPTAAKHQQRGVYFLLFVEGVLCFSDSTIGNHYLENMLGICFFFPTTKQANKGFNLVAFLSCRSRIVVA